MGRETRARISKQELKRIRNREAARKSRNMKKDLLNQLALENNLLKEENERLKLEIETFKASKACTDCTMKTEGEPLEEPFESIPVAEEIISEHLESKSNHRKTDDDVRYERIVAESEDYQGWQKFFLAIIFAVLIFWVKKEDPPSHAGRFGFFSFSFNSQ